MSLLFHSFKLREVGVVIKDVDITSGEVIVNLNEEMLSKSNSSIQSSSQFAQAKGSTFGTSVFREERKKRSTVPALSKYTSMLPEKVCELFIVSLCVCVYVFMSILRRN